MIREHPFLPLYFGVGDEELWALLQTLPPEKRVETAKLALKEFFERRPEFTLTPMGTSEITEGAPVLEEAKVGDGAEIVSAAEVEKTSDKEEAVVVEQDEEEQGWEQARNNAKNDALPNGELSLESLFIPSEIEVRSDPVKNLLSIIGEEEDEEVLEFLLGNADTNEDFNVHRDRREVHSQKSGALTEFWEERPLATTGNKGLDHLFQNVIGKEEDEEVIRFFRGTAK